MHMGLACLQRTKIENTYSTWLDIIFRVLQGSILGPLLFDVFLADLFFTVNDTDIISYADDNTPYMIADPLSKQQIAYLNGLKTIF